MTKNFKLTPTMKILTEILNEYVAENKPREFELLEIYQIVRTEYKLEICIHSLKNYLEILTSKKFIRCAKKTGKYRLPTQTIKFEPTSTMTRVLSILNSCTLQKTQLELEFSKLYNYMKNEYDISESSLEKDLEILVEKNKITYLKKYRTYKLKMTKATREKTLIVA